MITNFKRNCMGTTDFDGKFEGMRKAQDFIAYAIGSSDDKSSVKIQSDTRIGYICLKTGLVMLSPPFPGGAYQQHTRLAKPSGTLTGEDLTILKAHVLASASGKAGTNGVMYVDNSGALDVFAETVAS
jgi:hypothetical protein